jgi:hypothetical protein
MAPVTRGGAHASLTPGYLLKPLTGFLRWRAGGAERGRVMVGTAERKPEDRRIGLRSRRETAMTAAWIARRMETETRIKLSRLPFWLGR